MPVHQSPPQQGPKARPIYGEAELRGFVEQVTTTPAPTRLPGARRTRGLRSRLMLDQDALERFVPHSCRSVGWQLRPATRGRARGCLRGTLTHPGNVLVHATRVFCEVRRAGWVRVGPICVCSGGISRTRPARRSAGTARLSVPPHVSGSLLPVDESPLPGSLPPLFGVFVRHLAAPKA